MGSGITRRKRGCGSRLDFHNIPETKLYFIYPYAQSANKLYEILGTRKRVKLALTGFRTPIMLRQSIQVICVSPNQAIFRVISLRNPWKV